MLTLLLLAGVILGVLASILRPATTLAAPVRALAFGTVGAASGTAMTRPVLATIADRPLTALSGVLATLAVSLAAGQLLRLDRTVSPVTAVFSSIAGGASGITVLARQYGADEAAVLGIQYLRVLAVTITIPVMAHVLGTAHSPTGQTTGTSTGQSTVLITIAVGGGYAIARLLRMAAAQVFIPLILAAVLTATGVLPRAHLPELLLAVAYGIVGLTVGLGLNATRLRALARLLPLAILQILVGLVACTGIGVVFARAAGISTLDGYLATTPGGLPAVAAITLQYGHEVGLIMAMQAVRLVAALSLAPLIGNRLARRSRPVTGSD